MAAQMHGGGIEVTTRLILQYLSTSQQGIVTTANKASGLPGEVFAVIYGTEGFVEVVGKAPSILESFNPKQEQGSADRCLFKREMRQGHQKYQYAPIGREFVYENTEYGLGPMFLRDGRRSPSRRGLRQYTSWRSWRRFGDRARQYTRESDTSM